MVCQTNKVPIPEEAFLLKNAAHPWKAAFVTAFMWLGKAAVALIFIIVFLVMTWTSCVNSAH